MSAHYIHARIRQMSDVCTHAHYIILYELLNEIYNINSIYTMNLWILSLYVLINSWIHFPTEKLLACAVYLMSYYLAGRGEWI